MKNSNLDLVGRIIGVIFGIILISSGAYFSREIEPSSKGVATLIIGIGFISIAAMMLPIYEQKEFSFMPAKVVCLIMSVIGILYNVMGYYALFCNIAPAWFYGS